MTQNLTPFCPDCSAYFPSGTACTNCGHRRPALEIPPPPGEPFWKIQVPGSVGGRICLASLGGQAVLAIPWFHTPHRGDGRPADGGVTLVRLEDGSTIWSTQLGMPVEGGVGLAEEALIVGMGQRGLGAGAGMAAALSLQTGQVLWRVQLGGTVRCAPQVDKVRAYIPAGDGFLYCLDVRDGREAWRALISEEAVQVPASPVIVEQGGLLQALLVGTYGQLPRNEIGKLVAFDERGRRLWDQDAGGNVRGAPLLLDGKVYVPAFRNSPSLGMLSAVDAYTGRPAWPQPFRVQAQPGDRASFNFSASPLLHAGKLFIGSLNGSLYALAADTGLLLWEAKVGCGIASVPAWVEDLVVFGTNDGKIFAVEAETGQKAWEYSLGNPVLTGLLEVGGVVLAGSDGGQVAALPWHMGHYDWAAERLEKAARFQEAGDCQALAAHHFSLDLAGQEQVYKNAEEDWNRAGEQERSARLWLGLAREDLAAETFKAAGYRWRTQNPARAALNFWEAARLYHSLRKRGSLTECTRLLASCARLPFIQMQAVNVGTFIQREPGDFTLRLTNNGNVPIPDGVKLWMGGALKTEVRAEIRSYLVAGQECNLSLSVTPTCPSSDLDVELEYDSGVPEFTPLRSMLSILIKAEPPRQDVKIGDVGVLQLTIASTTQEGLAIFTRDVGAVRSQGGIGSINAGGDMGAIVSHGDISQVQTGGDVGAVSSKGDIDQVQTGGDVGIIKNG